MAKDASAYARMRSVLMSRGLSDRTRSRLTLARSTKLLYDLIAARPYPASLMCTSWLIPQARSGRVCAIQAKLAREETNSLNDAAMASMERLSTYSSWPAAKVLGRLGHCASRTQTNAPLSHLRSLAWNLARVFLVSSWKRSRRRR